jgi:hypothetical protein
MHARAVVDPILRDMFVSDTPERVAGRERKLA